MKITEGILGLILPSYFRQRIKNHFGRGDGGLARVKNFQFFAGYPNCQYNFSI